MNDIERRNNLRCALSLCRTCFISDVKCVYFSVFCFHCVLYFSLSFANRRPLRIFFADVVYVIRFFYRDWMDLLETTYEELRLELVTRTKKSSISWSWSANVNVILQLSICICKEKPSRENMKSQTQSQPMTDDRPTFHETLSLSPWRGPTFKRRLKSCFSKHPCSSLLGLFAVFYAHCHPSADSLKHFSFASRSLTLYLTVFCVCFPCVVIILWTLR